MKFENDLMKYRNDAAISYLGQLLQTRDDIKEQLAKPNKDLGECMNYLMSCARKQRKGQYAVMSDDEALSMAVHYYDEDDIEVEKISGAVSASPALNNNAHEHDNDSSENVEKLVSERVEKEVARIKEEVSKSNKQDVEKLVSERVQNELERMREEERKNKKEKKAKKSSRPENATTIFDFMEA